MNTAFVLSRDGGFAAVQFGMMQSLSRRGRRQDVMVDAREYLCSPERLGRNHASALTRRTRGASAGGSTHGWTSFRARRECRGLTVAALSNQPTLCAPASIRQHVVGELW